MKDEEFINQIYGAVSKAFKTETIYLKGKDGVGRIVLFDESELIPGEMNRYKYQIQPWQFLTVKNW